MSRGPTRATQTRWTRGVLGILSASSLGCVATHVASVQDTAPAQTEGGSGSAGRSDTATNTASTAAPNGTDSGSSCDLPPVLAECDLAADPLRALEITCQDGISGATFRSDDDDAWRRAREFGNAFWVSEGSDAVLVLSTGRLPLPNAAGQVAVEPSVAQTAGVDNDNPDEVPLPDPIVSRGGSASQTPFSDCDGVGDCSQTMPGILSGGLPRDLLWLGFEAEVPDDAHSYRVDVALLTAEYPERLGDPSSDTFVWWTVSEAFTGNLATLNGQPATVSGLASRLEMFSDPHPMLTRTGFDGSTGEPCTVGGVNVASCPVGAATGWMELRGPAAPGERLSVVAALFDQGDPLLDTVVVLDRWRWSCESCEPGESCGLR